MHCTFVSITKAAWIDRSNEAAAQLNMINMLPSDTGSSCNNTNNNNNQISSCKQQKQRNNRQLMASSRILLVFDATKDRTNHEVRRTINNIRMQGTILHFGDTIRVFGVLHKVLHPMGYQMGVAPENFLGATHTRALEEDVLKKVDLYVSMLQYNAEECEREGVDIEVKITAGTPIRKVVLQEVATSGATWVVLDRHLRKEMRYYLKHIPCKVAQVVDNLSLEILSSHGGTFDKELEHMIIDDKPHFYSLSKPVPLPPLSDNENSEQTVISLSFHESSLKSCSDRSSIGSLSSPFKSSSKDIHHSFSSQQRGEVLITGSDSLCNSDPNRYGTSSTAITPKQRRRRTNRERYLCDAPVLCVSCGLKTDVESMKYSYSEIQHATHDFSYDNLLGEGGYGHVYKGVLKDGQPIAAKVRKEESTQGFSEFHSEVFVLSFARHKNIVMLLGYCCKENINILVYEYICNKSLEWHLFENTNDVLEWHRRRAIAIGTAKGLRFLHEECRGSPVIHRDVRPSNILLTHDFVPMLGDFGLAKWKTDEDEMYTTILGTFGYLAPEYVENGIVSVLTDVYSFGIVLIQLISGRKAVLDSTSDGQQPLSIRQWALPLIEMLALHKLADARLGESYNTYELYRMARTAYLCVQTEPELRPSMAEVLRLLEGDSDHLNHLFDQFIPHYSK